MDDHGIDRIESLRRLLHQPSKKGAIIRPDLVRGGLLQTRTAPVWDPQEELWKLWCMDFSITPEEHHGQSGFSPYFESRDGVHWTAPTVGLSEYRGSRNNNLVHLPLDEGSTGELFCVIYDADDPDPSRRFKGFSYVRGAEHLVMGSSPDGRRWRRLDAQPLPSYDECNLSFDAASRRFLATVKVEGPYGRAHALSTSEDFHRWTAPQLVFHADEEDQRRAVEVIRRHLGDPRKQQPIYSDPADYAADIYNFPAFRYEGIYLALPMVFYHIGAIPTGNHDGIHHAQLACSRDLRRWQRVGDRQPFLDLSPVGAGAYDILAIVPPSYPIPRGDELWFYYSGIKYRHIPADADRDQGAICLATLRRDGFVSLDAGDTEGSLTTEPFPWQGGQLCVNAAAEHGALTCELLDRGGTPLPGFARSDCAPTSGDAVRLPVQWRAQASPAPAAGAAVRLRFYLRRARLFSYWFE